MILTTAAGITDSGFSGTNQPIFQNLGPGVLYIGPFSTDLSTKGLKLPVNAVYEYPAVLVLGDAKVYMQAIDDSCDVRIMNVG
jgi:hypothetical protein